MTALAEPASKPIGVYRIDGNDSDSMSGELFAVPLRERTGNAELKRYESEGIATQAARPAKRVRVDDAHGGDCCDHGRLKYTGCIQCEEEICAEIAETEDEAQKADPFCDHGHLHTFCGECQKEPAEYSSEGYVPKTPSPARSAPPPPALIRRKVMTKAFLKKGPAEAETKWPKARRMIIPDTTDREEILALRSKVRRCKQKAADLKYEYKLRDDEHADLETRVTKLLAALRDMDDDVKWSGAVAAARDALLEYDL